MKDVAQVLVQSSNQESTVTGTLESWKTQTWDEEEEFILWGNVYGDTKHRFRQGAYIHTAGISGNPAELKEGDLVTTRNSVYKLGKKREI